MYSKWCLVHFFLTNFVIYLADECNDSKCQLDMEFAKPILDGNEYANPPSFSNGYEDPSFLDFFKWWFFEEDRSAVPSDDILDKTLPVFKPKFDLRSKLSATWLGHSTVFVHMDNVSFITDPMWSHRASPVSFMGPRRYRPPPCEVEDLPHLNFILISHNHYDHLDDPTIKQLAKRFPNAHWFVPSGVFGWMKKRVGNDKLIHEMTWGQHINLTINNRRFEFWCTPSQHNSRRGILDGNESLWAGWVVIGPEQRFYYTGDTGFAKKEFEKIGKKLGPFDLSAIPIGAYAPQYIMNNIHIAPWDAVKLHQLVRSRNSIAIHWGTYMMGSNEAYMEPVVELNKAIRKANTTISPFFTLGHGKTWAKN